MAILNKEIFAVNKVIEDMADDLPTKEELRTMKENAADLEERLAEAESVIEYLKNDKNAEELKLDIQEDEIDGLNLK